MRRTTLALLAATAAITLSTVPAPADAAEHTVKMLTRGDAGTMVFEPAFLQIAPGDTVVFESTQPSHNAELIAGMAPEGAEPFRGGINETFAVTFAEPGVYGYKCLPHYAMGMVGLIQVGDAAPNLSDAGAVGHPGKAGPAFAELFAAREAAPAATDRAAAD